VYQLIIFGLLRAMDDFDHSTGMLTLLISSSGFQASKLSFFTMSDSQIIGAICRCAADLQVGRFIKNVECSCSELTVDL
jgi:hypothetical protein